ncbi:MAG: YbhB/YbcL family Raf kinase inhibitor-like protein [Candidatus Brocadiia bacterium]
MELSSRAFDDGGMIPSVYTCDGKDISPPLEISDVPPGTESLVLIIDDPDAPAGTWDHWLLWNIPPETQEIPEDTRPQSTAGTNDFGKREYGGPCPPSGTHTYLFKLYALDIVLNLSEGAKKQELEDTMEGHILGECVLKGDYSRS